MKNRKAIVAIVLTLVMVFALTACGETKTGGEGGGNIAVSAQRTKDIYKDPIVINYIPMSTAMENTPVIVSAMKDALACYPNVTLNVYDTQFDPNNQITLINEAITQGVDGIIVQCADSVALNRVIDEAEAAGIVVFTMNIGNTASPSMHITNSDYRAGYEAAAFLDGYLGGEGNLIILDVAPEIKETCPVATGFEDYIDEHGVFNLLENVGMVTLVEQAYNAMRDLLTKYSDIDLIYCANDNQSIGAYQAIKEAGRENEGIIIFGFEGQPTALDAIKKGTVFGTSYSDPYYESFVMTCMLLHYIELGINSQKLGLEYTPSLELGVTIVTAENIDAIIANTHWDMSAYNK